MPLLVSDVCSPQSLVDLLSCYKCLSAQQVEAIRVYALCKLSGQSCDPSDLVADASGLNNVSDEDIRKLETALMVRWSNDSNGISMDVQSLVDLTGCLACLPVAVLKRIGVRLLCEELPQG